VLPFFSLPEIVEGLDVENVRTNIQTNYPKQRCNCLDQLMRDVYILYGPLYGFCLLTAKEDFTNTTTILHKAI